MKVFSKKTIRQLCALSPELLAEKKIVTPARHVGHICPHCKNGSGTSGTGVVPKFEEKSTGGYWHWWCPKCGRNFNNISVFAAHYELDRQKDFAQIVERACADCDVKLEFVEKDEPKLSRKRKKKSDRDEKISDAELAFIKKDLSLPISDLSYFIKFGTDNGLWRGLPLDILLEFGCRYDRAWTHVKNRVKGQYLTPTPRMLVPVGDSGYLARLTIDEHELAEIYDEKQRGYIYPKEHVGKKVLFNARDLKPNQVTFAVEGAIDGMSVAYAGYPCVATGGANEYLKLVDAVEQMPEKPLVIVMFDGDDTGRKFAPTLVDELVTVGCPAVARFLSEEKNSTLDANQILDEHGVEVLQTRLEEIFTDAQAELNAVAQVVEQRRQERLAAKVDELFQGDSSDYDFARRLETFCGDSVRWLTDDEKWLMFKRNEHGGATWQRGSEKNSAILPFAKKMTDAMIEYAANDKEKELAEKFKSAKKVLASVTLLKGVENLLISSADLNRHAELVNCLDCVINLQTGETMNAAPELYMTQTINATFRQPVKKENLDFVRNFFAQIMPDEMTRRGLIRWLAYCLTAETNAEKFLVWIGDGANGKGSLSNAVLNLFGNYGVGLPSTALLKTNKPVDADKATNALNSIKHMRFSICEEMPLNGEIDSSLVKNLTGGDKINLRANYREYRTLVNTVKLNLSGNYAPRLENVRDGGILRRILFMPFLERFGFGTSEKPADPNLKKKMILPENLAAMLAILVADAKNFYEHGLIISDLMTKATEKNLRDSDFVEDFICENFVRDEGASVKVKEFIDELKFAYPSECRPFRKRADLISLVASVEGITYGKNQHNANMFFGIRKPTPKELNEQAQNAQRYDTGFVSSDDYEVEHPPFN